MLTKFSVSNFKGFNSELVFDLKDTNAYAFNTDSIKNGVVNNALVYGPNGVGKSNLGFAIFDIIAHLTDKRIDESQYLYYLNALNESDSADFQYEFQFDSNTVIYKYKKTQYDIVIFESFSINEKELAFIDKKKNNEAKVGFKGTESLKTNMTDQNLSLLKYIKNNSVLVENEENNCFEKFFVFVDRMLFFRSLKENMYLGLQIGKKTLDEDIIEKGNVADLQAFLNSAGVDCKLTVIKESDKDVIAFDFNGKTIAYYRIASSG
ncbi:MAG: ATP-binding protein, partial [Bacteroidales bacterium]|nr:ATP-binding protein [Bacteroidales bacterium]